LLAIKIDGLVKSQEVSFFVIPAKAGIQSRKAGFNQLQNLWTPFFNGVTTFYECIKIPVIKKEQRKSSLLKPEH